MFVGHYGVSFAAKPMARQVPLWVWFIAVQWLDVVWSALVIVLALAQVYANFGPPPPSDKIFAITALAFYGVFALLAHLVERFAHTKSA